MCNYQMILLSVPSFTNCLSSRKSTCHGKEIKPRIPSKRYIDCERLCKEDNNCNFIFYIPGKHCLKYSSCEDTKETENVGSTYSKNGFCPGTHISLIDRYLLIYFDLFMINYGTRYLYNQPCLIFRF